MSNIDEDEDVINKFITLSTPLSEEFTLSPKTIILNSEFSLEKLLELSNDAENEILNNDTKKNQKDSTEYEKQPNKFEAPLILTIDEEKTNNLENVESKIESGNGTETFDSKSNETSNLTSSSSPSNAQGNVVYPFKYETFFSL